MTNIVHAALWTSPVPFRRSLNFVSASTQFLNRTFGSGNRKTFTFFTWIKKTGVTAAAVFARGNFGITAAFQLKFDSNGIFDLVETNSSGSVQWRRTTNTTFPEDVWLPLTIAFDTTNATGSNRIRIYFGHDEVTSFSATTDPSLNFDTLVNENTGVFWIGKVQSNGSDTNILNGKLAGTVFVDGLQLTPSSFITPQSQPKRYIGSLGTNGFNLNYENPLSTTTLGQDDGVDGAGLARGSNNWTLNNMSTANSHFDLPKRIRT